MFCPRCGKEIDDRATFCSYCGTRNVRVSGSVTYPQPNNTAQKTPFYKHWLFGVVIVLLIAAAIYGNGTASEGSHNNPSSNTGTHVGSESNSSTHTAVSVANQILYSENGISITATGISTTSTKTEISLLVENTTEKNIAVGCSDFVVNGITVDGYMYIDVAAGKKANGKLSLDNDALEIAGIETIATIKTFDAYISDTDTYFKTDHISFSVTTSAVGYTQSVDESGDILFSQDGIVVIAKHIYDELLGKTMVVLVKNATGQDVTVQADNVSVNGYTISVLHSDDIPNGSVRFCELYISDSRLEENGIETIDTITFTLKVFGADNWDTLLETGELECHVVD